MATEQPEQVAHSREAVPSCYWHPEVETRLSCSRCGKSMCAHCLVQAPVGIRCRECGKAQPMPTYDVQPTYYARALGVAVLLIIGLSVLWIVSDRLLLALGAFSSVSSMLAIPVGYGTGELISRAVNRKRGVLLSYIGGAAVVLAYLSSRVVSPFGFGLYDVLFVAVGVYFAWQRLRR